ncbi:MAG: lysophospholipid acyltransferase family protein [Verrucomicrobiaceae bacterium]|nr:lysophospholipid acyltransferase family protein [Verrucomicrobiaceae bacterium]
MKKVRYFLEALLVRGMARFLPLLPRHGLLSLARLTGTLAWLADAAGRATAMENLRVAFRNELNTAERRRIVHKCYQNFARTFLDLFWLARLTDDNWRDFVTCEDLDPERLKEDIAAGAIWVTAHFGNFELSSTAWGFRGMKMVTVAQDFKNPALTPIFQNARSTAGHVLIPQQGAMIRLMKTLGRGGYVALLSDLNLPPGRAATVINCFGLKTCVTTLHTMLARRLGCSVIPSVCFPREDGSYILKTYPPVRPVSEDDVHAATQQVWDIFEADIRRQPELWMWMYKHWRYLPGEEQDPDYPDYANPSAPFRKLAAARSVE